MLTKKMKRPPHNETASVFLALNGSLNYFSENVDEKVEKAPKSTFSSTFFFKMLTEKLKRPPQQHETASF